MRIHAVAALAQNRGIGQNGSIPWRCYADLRNFAATTKSGTKNAVVMGRKTWESLRVKPLGARINFVLSTTMETSDNVYVVDYLDKAIGMAENFGCSDLWIIGGERLYQEAVAREDVSSLVLTHVPHDGRNCDRFFPATPDWEPRHCEVISQDGIMVGEDTRLPGVVVTVMYKRSRLTL